MVDNQSPFARCKSVPFYLLEDVRMLYYKNYQAKKSKATFICQRRLGMWQLYSWCGPAALLLVPSELLLSAHSSTSEGWTAELTAGLWLMVPMTGFEPTRVGLA